MFDLVLTDTGKKKKLNDFYGTWLFLAGKCPHCGKYVARAAVEAEEVGELPNLNLSHLKSCKIFPSIEAIIVTDG